MIPAGYGGNTKPYLFPKHGVEDQHRPDKRLVNRLVRLSNWCSADMPTLAEMMRKVTRQEFCRQTFMTHWDDISRKVI